MSLYANSPSSFDVRSSSKSPSPSLATYALRYPSLSFFTVDAPAHPAILAEADVAHLPADGSPLFLFYEAGEGCVDAVVGSDGANLGRTLKLFNPGPGSEPSSPVSPGSPEVAWLVPESPVVTFSSRWGFVEEEEVWSGGKGFAAFA